MLQAWIKYPPRQAALTRKIVDRIRNSLQLQVVLQTAVDELAALLQLDCCSFFWYFEEGQRVEIVCKRSTSNSQPFQLGYQALESVGEVACAIATGKLIVNSGTAECFLNRLGSMAQRFLGLIPGVGEHLKSHHKAGACSTWCGTKIATPLGTWDGLQCKEIRRCHQGNHNLWGYKASLLIPVRGKEGGIGYIACLSEQPRPWAAPEIQFLELIAESLEIAIRQAQLYEQTQKQAIREQLVNHITTQTRQSFDLEVILTEAITHLRSALDADRCLVHLVEDCHYLNSLEIGSEPAIATGNDDTFNRNHLYEVCSQPFTSSVKDFDPNGPITQWVIQHRQLVIISDISQDERIGQVNQEYQKAQIKSSLAVPVQANGTLYAILYLNQCSDIRYWSKHDQELAQAVANQLAISLQQAYLYARTRQQAAHSKRQAQKLSEMIEELRLTQAQLIQSEKLSSLGRMVAGVAHELNNPINFISGNIPYVEHYIKDLIRLVQAYQCEYSLASPQVQQLAEEVQVDFVLRDLPKILQSMQSGAERVHEVVRLLQKFSRHNEASLKPIDINAALENIMLILHNQLINTIKIERHYDDLPRVECYPKQINQAFLSILTNAVEALNRSQKPDKTLTLRTQWIRSSDLNKEGRVQVAIADNGPGIQLEIQPNIFEPFFTTKEVGEGRGLGLTVSYQTIVNQHHGQLKVNSQLGQGTEFLLEIPVRHHHSIQSEPMGDNSQNSASPAKSPTVISNG
ncbi:GAF domain-containing protein [Coleofasciculus sp. LEGE 07092]|uniref:GAF domain-containing protein n=1 Tax=Coleofasciculus sp. LEGE 07092 TaxID=2777969 RepID=UPI001D155317|nr:GAF domain-containing protein [Coleofasciculus sp. LEGE 07092]